MAGIDGAHVRPRGPPGATLHPQTHARDLARQWATGHVWGIFGGVVEVCLGGVEVEHNP